MPISPALGAMYAPLALKFVQSGTSFFSRLTADWDASLVLLRRQ